MWVPTLHGLIDRRILVNYRVDPEVMAWHLPAPFRPKVVRGFGLAGICLIRLQKVRPRFVPFSLLGPTENAALRFAVEWDHGGQSHSGVCIPRRFTTSRLVTLVGGRFFPGVHSRATFAVAETEERYSVEMRGELNLTVRGTVAADMVGSQVFPSLDEASAFYRGGAVGYSDTFTPGKFEGLEFRIANWNVTPLAVEEVACDFFDDAKRFPPGSAVFDNALLMRGMVNEFHGRGALCCPVPAVVGERVPASAAAG